MKTLQQLAREVSAQFEYRPRCGDKSEDASKIWIRKDNAEDWIKNLCFEAHKDHVIGDMLPDDIRYEYIVSALGIIAEASHDDLENEDFHQAIDGSVDVYNHDLTSWLASHNSRQCYCDESATEYGQASTLIASLMAGQFMEREIVLRSVFASLKSQLDNDSEEVEEKTATATD